MVTESGMIIYIYVEGGEREREGNSQGKQENVSLMPLAWKMRRAATSGCKAWF